MPRLGLLLCLVATVQLACGSSRTVRYRLPLAGNPGADACYATCSEARAARGDDAFLSCLASCPGVEQTLDARCDLESDRDQPPTAACATARESRPGDGGVVVSAIIVVTGVVLVGALVFVKVMSGG